VLAIPEDAIDHDLARGLQDSEKDAGQQEGERPSGLTVLLTCRPLLIFAVCVVLFHLSNAAMLPLVGQKLALQDKNLGTSLMSACIVAAQIVMVPMAMLVAPRRMLGTQTLVLAHGFDPADRGVLYTFRRSLLAGGRATLDGVGAGIYGRSFPSS
jgi:hypothetical protein